MINAIKSLFKSRKFLVTLATLVSLIAVEAGWDAFTNAEFLTALLVLIVTNVFGITIEDAAAKRAGVGSMTASQSPSGTASSATVPVDGPKGPLDVIRDAVPRP